MLLKRSYELFIDVDGQVGNSTRLDQNAHTVTVLPNQEIRRNLDLQESRYQIPKDRRRRSMAHRQVLGMSFYFLCVVRIVRCPDNPICQTCICPSQSTWMHAGRVVEIFQQGPVQGQIPFGGLAYCRA